METRANYVAVGIFTIFAIVAAFGFIYWTARIGSRGDTALLRFRIAGSAAGLGRGSAVLFNGVKVGDVKHVYIDPTNSKFSVADAEVNRDTPVTTVSEANVGIAGLTGQANIEIAGVGKDESQATAENLFEKAEKEGGVAEIKTAPSAVTNLLESAQDIFKRADSVLGGLQAFVQDSREPLTQTIKNVEVFSEALKKNASGVDDFLASAGKLSDTLNGVSGKIGGTLDSAKRILDSVDQQKVANIVANIDTFTNRLKSASTQLDQIMANVDSTVKSVHELSDSAKGTISKVDKVVDAVDPASVKAAIDNIQNASQTAKEAISAVAKTADKIGDHADDVDEIVRNAKDISQRLNDASVRVNGVLAKVDKLLGSGDANGLMRQASDTLKSFKQVADTLNAQLGPITAGVAHFSGQGLRNVDSLVQEMRRAVEHIDEAVDSLARNPAQIITGGNSGSVPRYNGRARH
ncbi:MAG: MlaD family protein [Rhizobiaceae bacterium]|jgi:phospholipid/cholesterol/gamma-HCH transport system substrate-binding protein